MCRDCLIADQGGDDSCYDWDDRDYEDPPLYPHGALLAMSEEQLAKEWSRQCSIHDHGVDRYEMGHYVIEDAQARMNLVEREQSSRGFRKGPLRND